MPHRQVQSSGPCYALLIPDGVGFRNCVLGPVLQQLSPSGRVQVYHPATEDLLARTAPAFGSNVQWSALRAYPESLSARWYRMCAFQAHLAWGNTSTMRHLRQRHLRGRWISRLLQRMAAAAGDLAGNPGGIAWLSRRHFRSAGASPEVQRWKRELAELRPGVLFCAHQRPLVTIPAVLAAQSLGIPTAVFVFSWDNLTSQGRMPAPFDHYLVWSELMRTELRRYYPEVPPERIHIVGTPQFDPYADGSLLWPRQEFFERIGADPARRLICFSGGDQGTCPEDSDHLRVLLELVRAGRIDGRPQVIARPAPVDDGKRYESVRRDFPELIFAQPAWVQSGAAWSSFIPLPEDIRFLANLTHHADLNVNMASTMSLDFALHDKPVVNLAFDCAGSPPLGAPVWDLYYHFEHYRPVVELGAARFARSPEELAGHINAYLADPALDREGRRKLVELEVDVPIGGSSRRLVEALQQIAGGGQMLEQDAVGAAQSR